MALLVQTGFITPWSFQIDTGHLVAAHTGSLWTLGRAGWAEFFSWCSPLVTTLNSRKRMTAKPRIVTRVCYMISQQETQLSLTNLRDAFIGQSRSPNIVFKVRLTSYSLNKSDFCISFPFFHISTTDPSECISFSSI